MSVIKNITFNKIGLNDCHLRIDIFKPSEFLIKQFV